ncbi:DUF58 domain-containing protein [Aquisalimonas asiatica]|uniref:Uncharacterized conserved protein, DUF58 family, contains vWF domain n=1 Tax=Aquisalimonas asiatica TaxID=406100 RepID=A0A1H8QQ81_9GAMM|nr:DUF58 domain-containing protein [Aquisalimonas asiatica]SEO55983.1 Uncharacterized conserved protein, DUF58 family, contains vWF domain [Aquisalimonas asiatica]
MTAGETLPGGALQRWIDRRSPLTRTAELRYRRIFILPTGACVVFAAMVIAIWLGAVNYSNNMAFLLCFLLVGVALVAIVHTFRNLHGIVASPRPTTAVFAGQQARFTVALDNPSPRERSGISVRQPDQAGPCIDIPGDDTTTVTIAVATRERGSLTLPPLVIESRFPAGLFRAWSRIRLDARCVVYPAPEGGTVPPPGADDGGEQGATNTAGDDDFSGLRRYRPADPLKRIHWRSLARERELQTKQFSGGSRTPVWLDFQSLTGMDTEARLSRLCRWVLDAEGEHREYGLVLPGLRIAPGAGAAHRHRCLEALARFPEGT